MLLREPACLRQGYTCILHMNAELHLMYTFKADPAAMKSKVHDFVEGLQQRKTAGIPESLAGRSAEGTTGSPPASP